MTLMLLWDEYKQDHLEGYQYSQFCDLYNRSCRKLDLVLRQEHRAGEKLFVAVLGRVITPMRKPLCGRTSLPGSRPTDFDNVRVTRFGGE